MSDNCKAIASVFRQFKNLQIDKLVVCKKELEHLHRIVCFYRSGTNDVYSKSFENIEDNVKDLYKSISKLSEEISSLNNEKPFKFLTYYALNEKRIENIIEQIGLLKDKVMQNTEEHFEQYIPKVLLGRRYSNKALTYFMEKYFYEILSCNGIEDQKPIFVWEHGNDYNVLKAEDRFDLNKHSIIKNAFWYYEIPYLIPNLIHEIGHILNQNREYQQFKKELDQIIEQPYKFADPGFVEEIYGDIIGYLYGGTSYILALFYSIAYKSFNILFFNIEYEDIQYIKPDKNTIDWRRFIEINIRLSLLIEIFENDENTKTISDEIKNHIRCIKMFINKYISYEENENELFSIYKRIPIYADNYKEILDVINVWRNAVLASLDIFESGYATNEFITKYKPIFPCLWEQKIKKEDKWLHKNNLREMLLKKVFENGTEIESEPYELVFIKKRFDNEELANINIQNIFYLLTNDGRETLEYHTFGIYSSMILAKKCSEIDYKEIKNYLQDEQNNEQMRGFYTVKYPLVKLKEVEGNENNNKNYGAVLQLQLSQMDEENIEKGFSEINTKLKNFEGNFSRCYIFKSLGPNDFLIFIEKIDIEDIFDLKKMFNEEKDIFRRSFTTIFLMQQEGNNDNSSNCNTCKIISRVRLKKPISVFIKFIEENGDLSKKINFYCSTGALDVTIYWNEESPRKVFDIILNNLNSHSDLISDIQTSIEYRLS